MSDAPQDTTPDVTDQELCDRLERLISYTSTDDELVNTFRRDQMKSAMDDAWVKVFGDWKP